MGAVIAFVLNNWRWLLVAALLAAVGIQTLRLDWCQKGRAEDQAKITVLGAQIAEQNRAVEALQAESARRLATSAAALRKAEERARTWDEQARRLQAVLTNRQPGGPKTCSEAWAEILRR